MIEKIKETCIRKYGVSNGGASKQAIKKIKATNIRKYGVANGHNKEVNDKIQLSRKRPKSSRGLAYDGVMFDSTYEVTVYKFLQKENFSFVYQPTDRAIQYFVKKYNEIHTYYPDFEVNGKLYEVKTKASFKNGKMWPIWRGKLSGKAWEKKCIVYEAKHRCMIDNGVMILTEHEIKNLEGVFTKTKR